MEKLFIIINQKIFKSSFKNKKIRLSVLLGKNILTIDFKLKKI